jgi:ORF6N domain-containing protein
MKADRTIEQLILSIRDQRVILAGDLATIYGVETRVLNQALRRNPDRFPDDFMFQLTPVEFAELKSRGVVSSDGQAALRSQSVILKGQALGSQNATLKRGQHIPPT